MKLIFNDFYYSTLLGVNPYVIQLMERKMFDSGYFVIFLVLSLATDSFASSHRFALLDENVTLSFTVARIAEMFCSIETGHNNDIIYWSQVHVHKVIEIF